MANTESNSMSGDEIQIKASDRGAVAFESRELSYAQADPGSPGV